MIKEVLIIGGGASGMVAAIIAARNGAKVTILEQQNEYGKKILATGNGRCNYTNMDISPAYFYSENMSFVEEFISEFSTESVLEFFHTIGISPRVRDSYVYPWSDQSLAIREALQTEMFRQGVEMHCGVVVHKLIVPSKDSETYTLETSNGTFRCHKCIIATGGNSGLSPKMEKKGFDLVKDTNHSIGNLCPALVGLKTNATFFKRLSGVRTDARIKLMVDNQLCAEETGELQLTDYGISGIPVFQISRVAGMNLINEKSVKAVVDFVPHLSIEQYIELLVARIELFKGSKMKAFINGLFKDKLALFLLEQSDLTLSTQVCDITKEEIEQFAYTCKNLTIDIIALNDYSKAQVTAGGISLNEISSEFESQLHKNLYFIGEVLDVDGICGGYNLHFAWGSGIKAGFAVANR